MYKLIFGLCLAFLGLSFSCQNQGGQSGDLSKPPFPYDEADVQTTPEGLKYVIVQEGTGESPQPGDKVTANYHGMLENDTIFDSSFDRNEPFSFMLGRGQVIKGWDLGFQLLKKGAKAVLIVPPDLGYGQQARGKIPANATLYFHVELVDFEKGKDYAFKYDKTKLESAASGLQFHFLEKGTGPTPKEGDKVTLNFHALKGDGNVFQSSFEQGRPMEVPFGQTGIAGLDEAIAMSPVGSKMVAIIPPALGLGQNGMRMGVSPDDTLEFHIELLNAEKEKDYSFNYNPAQLQTTQSGLKYAIIEKGTGAVPKQGQTITAHYHGKLENGKVFDSSYKRGQPFQAPIGVGRVIPGWDEAFQMLPVGSKAVLVVPPNLGYGAQGMPQGGIPPNATLEFHVELLGVE